MQSPKNPYAKTTTLLPESEATLRRALGVLNLIAAGELAGEEAAQAARDVMDEVDAIPGTDVVYEGVVHEWDKEREAVSYPIKISRTGHGALYVALGNDGEDAQAAATPQIGLLLEVNLGRPCIHVWPDARCESSSIATFFGDPKPDSFAALLRIDGDLGEPQTMEETGWVVRPIIGDSLPT